MLQQGTLNDTQDTLGTISTHLATALQKSRFRVAGMECNTGSHKRCTALQACLLTADIQLSMLEGERLLCSSAVVEQQCLAFKVTLPQAD